MRREIHLALAVVMSAYVAIMGVRVLYTLLALEIGANAFEIGLIAGASQLPMLLLSIPVALAVERFGARWVLLLGSACGVLGLLLPYLFPTVPALLAGSLLLGMANVLVYQPSQALVGALSAPEQLARNFSLYMFWTSLTGLAGPAAAGVAIDLLGHVNSPLVFLPFTLVSALLLLFRGAMLPGGGDAARAAGARLGDTLADPEVRRLIVVSSIAMIGVDLYPFLLPLHGHAAGLSASSIGGIVSAAALGGVALPLALPYMVRRMGDERTLAVCLGLTGLAFIMVPFVVNVPVLVLSSLVFGFASYAANPITSMLAYARMPEARAGQFLGVRNCANAAVRVVVPPAFGALAAAFALPAVFAVAFVTMVLSGVWVGRKRNSSLQQSRPEGER